VVVITRTHSRATAELAAALRPEILRLARRLRQMQDESVELTASQSSAMGVLLRRGDLSMGELAAEEQVRPPTVTRVVKGLEERGLVLRTPAPHDGRQSLVGLTGAGRAVLLANRRRRTEWLADRLGDLDADEQDLLRHVAPVLAKLGSA
jgi:DNA-binding MarR family transcriptional regulator